MDDVTDTVFRQITAECAPPDLFFTEFVNVDGLCSAGRPKLLKKLHFTAKDTPLIAQLWGLKPENFKEIARQLSSGELAQELGLPAGVNFAGIDLNMGCPAKSEVQNGACSALILNRELTEAIITATVQGSEQGNPAAPLPVSVKTRLGFNEVDFTWHEFLLSFKLNMLSIHGRTRKQMSKVPADWDAIGHIAALARDVAPATKIVGNGDVMSRQQGQELAARHGLDGIMIGRGIFTDPYVFAEQSPWETIGHDERIALYAKHVKLFAETWPLGEDGKSERNIKTLNKFCKVYISDFDGAKELREELMAADSTDELLTLLAQTNRLEQKQPDSLQKA